MQCGSIWALKSLNGKRPEQPARSWIGTQSPITSNIKGNCSPKATKYSFSPILYLWGYKMNRSYCGPGATIMAGTVVFDAGGLQMSTLADVADLLKDARLRAGLSQEELARRAGVS